MKRLIFLILVLGISNPLPAEKSSNVWQALAKIYPSAEKHRGLENANDNLDPAKVKSYVVVMKGGIPAERAAFYIGWGEYDYRGAAIDGDEVKTRRGPIYTFLQKGDVMALVSSSHIGRTFYLKLISPDVYIPENREAEKHHSRVTTMISLKLPKEIVKKGDDESAVQFVEGWLKPFLNLDDAQVFGEMLKK